MDVLGSWFLTVCTVTVDGKKNTEEEEEEEEDQEDEESDWTTKAILRCA